MSHIFPNKLSSEIINDRKRNAEVMVFNALKKAKLFSTQRVYYSASWLNTVLSGDAQSDGECDFIITDIDIGIIYIEVKGGHITKDTNNHWFSNGKRIKNPLEQAKKSKHVITKEFIKRWNIKYPLEKDPSLFRGHYVIFPNSSNQIQQDLGIFGNLKQFGFSEDIENITKLISQFFDYIPQGQNHLNFDKLGERGQEIFHEMLTKPLDFKPPLKRIIKDNSFEIENLTNEQNELLNQSVGKWKRLWIEGPAGSGKTVIALKKFQKEAVKSENAALICRAKNLQIKLKNAVVKDKVSLGEKIYTFDSFLLKLSNKYFTTKDKNFINNYLSNKGYKTELREFIINIAFDISHKIEKFDLLIIDESQDFEEQWWLLINELISKKSIVWIFGDANQKIWRTQKPEIKGISESYYLSSILRNTHQIAKQSLVLYDGKGHGIEIKGPYSSEVNIISTENIIDDLEIQINKLISINQVNEKSIVILGDKPLHNKISQISSNIYKISNDVHEDKSIFLSTIENFKGLESDCAIILIDDLEQLSDSDLYIGITRAKTYLVILVKKYQYKKLLERLT